MLLFLINLITVIFIGLKLSNVIAWSWWLVLLPTLFIVGIFIILTIIALLTFVVLYCRDRYYD